MYTYANFIGIIPTPIPTFVGGKQNLGEILFMGFWNCLKNIYKKSHTYPRVLIQAKHHPIDIHHNF